MSGCLTLVLASLSVMGAVLYAAISVIL